MTIDEINQSRLKDVHPTLAARISVFIGLAKKDGVTLEITQGLRTFEDQHKLFLEHHPTVTHADAGQSNHNYGLAVDLSPVLDGNKIDWNDSHYTPFHIWALGANLSWGGDWKSFKDRPHIELPNIPHWNILLGWYKNGGLVNVWKHF